MKFTKISDDDVKDAIREVMAKGVIIRIVKDPTPVGASCKWWPSDEQLAAEEMALSDAAANAGAKGKSAKFISVKKCRDMRSWKNDIEAAKGKVVAFNKSELCGKENKTKNCFQHGKIIIVDRNEDYRAALISTGNFNSSNLCQLKSKPTKCNRDFSYVTTDVRLIRALVSVFEGDLRGKRYDLKEVLSDPYVKRNLTVSPFSFEPMVRFLKSAKSNLQIQTQYLKDEDFIQALIELKKAKPNVNIEIQLAETCNYGSISQKDALRYTLAFNRFDELGIKIKMFTKKRKLGGLPGYMHAKVMVVDKAKAWVGSTNVSDVSFNHNREFGIFLANKERVTAFSNFLEVDFQDSTNSEWKDAVLNCRRKEAGKSSASKTETPDDEKINDEDER